MKILNENSASDIVIFIRSACITWHGIYYTLYVASMVPRIRWWILFGITKFEINLKFNLLWTKSHFYWRIKFQRTKFIRTPLKSKSSMHIWTFLFSHWFSNKHLNYFLFLFVCVQRNRQVAGELFAHTSKHHPFNIISNTTDSSNAISKEIVYRDIATPDILQPNSNVLQKLKERILRYVFQDQFFH